MKLKRLSLSKKAFTVVELLIVVIVIAILATVTIVAYNGVQKKSQTALYADAAAKIQDNLQLLDSKGKSAEVFNSTGLVPDGAYVFTACIGAPSDFPAVNGFEAGECFRQTNYDGSVSRYYASNVLDQRLTAAGFPKIGQMPHVQAAAPVDAVTRGIILTIYGGEPAYVQWFAPDMSGCARGNGTTALYLQLADQDPDFKQDLIDQYGPNWKEILERSPQGCLLPL